MMSGSKLWSHIWRQLITYRTLRQMEVQDVRVGLLHKACLLAAACYLVFTIFSSHAYMRKETPAVTVNAWVEGTSSFKERLQQYQADPEHAPWYCDSRETNYLYSEGFEYLNNSCAFDIFLGQATIEDSSAMEFVSYFQDRNLSDIAAHHSRNAFVPDIEDLYLVFSHSFPTALGVEGSNVETTVESKDGSKSKKFKEGDSVRIRVSELLNMAGIDLDDRNENSGGAPPVYGMYWPIYRMTGLSLPMELVYENFRSDKPFDFTKRLRAFVTAPDNVWMGRGRQVFAKWIQEEGSFAPFERYPQVISVKFQTAGEVGVPNAFEAIMNVGVSAAVFGLVKTVMDILAIFILKEFRDMKTLDPEEWETLEGKGTADTAEVKQNSISSSKCEKEDTEEWGIELKETNPIRQTDQPERPASNSNGNGNDSLSYTTVKK
eukprot:gb/GECG01006893.1/.p1 GENE.gb/GECG01006893.1/~~gb/GECG01006893.1/.p1  ORF type:complete len:433 (+),score=49.34 gb/GECG01006893.1/:1-1299(+)